MNDDVKHKWHMLDRDVARFESILCQTVLWSRYVIEFLLKILVLRKLGLMAGFGFFGIPNLTGIPKSMNDMLGQLSVSMSSSAWNQL